MADQKEKKGKPKPSSGDKPQGASWGLVGIVIVVLFLIGQGISYLLVFFGFKDADTGLMNVREVTKAKIFFTGFLNSFQYISLFITVILLMGLIYVKFRMYEMKRMDTIKKKVSEISEKKISEKPQPNKKWLKVQDHINSSNPSDWRLAILEADILLSEVLEKMGYKGVTIGDKLKTIERSDFTNLNAAWEAHKTRNAIAHEGSDFHLNQKEAKEVIGQYEKVFKEFYFI